MTKIDIFSGFLGAGKTTLIKKLLKEAYAGEKVVLIENEFGEIGIDGGFLQDVGIQITEMNSGCICCSLVGDFSKALDKVLAEYKPERVLIEPSGVGKLSDVIRAVKSISSTDYVLNSFTTVADAGKCKMYMKNFGEFFNDQVENASAIVLSHADKASEAKLSEAIALIRAHNPSAVIVSTPLDKLSGKDVLNAIELKAETLEEELAKLQESAQHHHHEHDDEHDEHCGCGHHHDHDDEHDEHCGCGHHHDHDDEHDEHCGCGHHHDHDGEHDEHCGCGHHHDHDGEHDEHCGCGHHHDHDEHDEHCGCGHHHDHDDEHDEHCGCGHHHDHHHHADEVFASFGVETAKKFTVEALSDILEALDEGSEYGMILRAKGIVAGEDGNWIHFDYVPGEPDIRLGSPAVIGRLCVIGSGIDREKLAALFGV